ncbi:hypothetical protein GGX14DRAFT_606123 [Mycena pura]|uniref:Uncharacterized protein n=1 Tax=Mycena pura TaxID=153505 RepID=A0AAD6Y1L7_9AGAR|nr:hypothetical protein GGX14DRAFT_606123 [Mycena pura]
MRQSFFELLLTNAPPAPWRILGLAYITHATQGFYSASRFSVLARSLGAHTRARTGSVRVPRPREWRRWGLDNDDPSGHAFLHLSRSFLASSAGFRAGRLSLGPSIPRPVTKPAEMADLATLRRHEEERVYVLFQIRLKCLPSLKDAKKLAVTSHWRLVNTLQTIFKW